MSIMESLLELGFFFGYFLSNIIFSIIMKNYLIKNTIIDLFSFISYIGISISIILYKTKKSQKIQIILVPISLILLWASILIEICIFDVDKPLKVLNIFNKMFFIE